MKAGRQEARALDNHDCQPTTTAGALEEAPMSSSRLTGPASAAHTDPQIARTQNRSASCARRPANNRLDTSGQAMNTVESALPMEQPWPT